MATKREPSNRWRGGEALKAKYGVEHFREMGRKGGIAVRDSGTDMTELGRKGGYATRERKGTEYYRTIGRLGGSRGRGKPKLRAGRRSSRI